MRDADGAPGLGALDRIARSVDADHHVHAGSPIPRHRERDLAGAGLDRCGSRQDDALGRHHDLRFARIRGIDADLDGAADAGQRGRHAQPHRVGCLSAGGVRASVARMEAGGRLGPADAVGQQEIVCAPVESACGEGAALSINDLRHAVLHLDEAPRPAPLPRSGPPIPVMR